MKKDDDVTRKAKERVKKLKELGEKIKVAEKLSLLDKKPFSQFTTRVELQGVITKPDYKKLDLEMSKERFTRTIILDGVFKMPTAEYNFEGKYFTREILDLAVHAAMKTGKKFTILVTKSAGREFVNLERLEK